MPFKIVTDARYKLDAAAQRCEKMGGFLKQESQSVADCSAERRIRTSRVLQSNVPTTGLRRDAGACEDRIGVSLWGTLSASTLNSCVRSWAVAGVS